MEKKDKQFSKTAISLYTVFALYIQKIKKCMYILVCGGKMPVKIRNKKIRSKTAGKVSRIPFPDTH